MATNEELVNALHAELTGGDVLGQYPDSVVDRLMAALDSAWDLVEAAGKLDQAQVIAGTELGPFTVPPTTKLADIREQVASRFRFDEASRPRTLAEAARQLEVLMPLLGDGTTTPPPPPAPTTVVPSSATLVGDLGFDNGWNAGWTNMQTRDRNGAPGTYSTYSASIRDGGPGHPTAARFEVRNGDIPSFGGGERSEVRASGTFDVRSGMESWYSWSMRLGDAGGTFPAVSGWGLIVMQWHSDEGSPPLSIHAENGYISLQNDRSGGYTKNVCPIDPGVWHDYVLHVKWSSSSSGLMEMWRDGQKFTSYNAANCVGSESNYLKAGIYRDAVHTNTHVVWHDSIKQYRA